MNLLNKFKYFQKKNKLQFKILATFWETIGNVWHGHEIIGFNNIPDKGPALLIYYHATVFPVDFFFVYSKTFLYKKRLMKTVADRFLFKIPGNVLKTR